MDEKLIAEVVKEAIRSCGEKSYNDLVSPGAKEFGKVGDTLGKVANMILGPVRMVALQSHVWMANYEKRITEKLKDTVPESEWVEPDPAFAGPLLMKAMFKEDQPDLREMFENLLIKSMCKQTASKAHPSFVEILSELTPDEAKIVKYFQQGRVIPVIAVCRQDKIGGRSYALRNICLIAEEAKCEHFDLTPMYLENLARLRLITLDLNREAPAQYYKTLERHLIVQYALKEIEANEIGVVGVIEKSVCQVTDFGWTFHKACMPLSPKDIEQANLG